MVIMILTAVSVAMSVFILHIHSLGDRSYRVPPWLHRLVARYLARLVGLGHIVKHRQRADLELSTWGSARSGGSGQRGSYSPTCSGTGRGTADEASSPLRADCNYSPRRTCNDPGGGSDDASRPLRVDCEDLNARYRLIQVQGSGLYILARDDENTVLEKDDKQEINDLHKIRDNSQQGRRVLRAMKAVMVRQVSDEEGECGLEENHHPVGASAYALGGLRSHRGSQQHLPHRCGLMWHDIAEILDRFFFWLSFIANTLSTLTILVVLPLSKPDPLENFEK